jgi:hydroxypyruvate isomerase
MPRFSANLSMLFNEVPFPDRFARAAAAGFRGVECLLPYEWPARQVHELLQETDLRLVLFNMPGGDWAAGDRGLACHPGRIGECRDGVGQAIEYARAVGCTRLHCMAGLKPGGFSDDAIRETYIANLQFAGRELARHGMTLLIEAINSRDVPDFYLSSSRQAFAIMDDAAVENLRFQYDLYHMQIMEGDLAPTLERHRARIGHIQLADTPGRHEPGTGEINYPFIFAFLDSIGYDGWIGCEYRPSGRTEDSLAWVAPYLEVPAIET